MLQIVSFLFLAKHLVVIIIGIIIIIVILMPNLAERLVVCVKDRVVRMASLLCSIVICNCLKVEVNNDNLM